MIPAPSSGEELRGAVAGRIGGISGLREALGILGPEYEGKQVIDRSFTVLLAAEDDAGGRTTTAGKLQVTRGYIVVLAHKLNPARGKAGLAQAYNDADDVKRAMLGHNEDAYLPCEPATSYLGTDEPESAGGSFLLTRIRFRTRFRINLLPAVV